MLDRLYGKMELDRRVGSGSDTDSNASGIGYEK